jgi:hypothetical protein
MQLMERRRITIALGIALAVHAGVIWWWSEKPVVEDNKPAAVIDLVLTQILHPDELVQSEQEVEKIQVRETLPEPIVQLPLEPQAIIEPAALIEAPSLSEVPAPQLDLSRPEDFARAFRGEFYQRLEQRQTAQARSQLLAGRRVAQRGLPADQYNALENPGSGHFKTAAGCFDLKPDIVGTLGGGQRAWITACKDLIRSPFELPALEFDALGRAVMP